MRQGSAADARLLAYHEAGHAVAAFVLKRPLSSLALHPPPPTGDVKTVVMPERTLEEAECDVIALMCGAEAEALLTGYCDWFAAQPDWEMAEAVITGLLAAGYRVWPRDEREAELVGGLDDDDPRAAWELLAERAHALISDGPAASAVASVAAALVAHQALGPEQVRRAIREGIAAADPG